MGYKLKAGGSVSKNVRRVVVEEIDKAIESLAQPKELSSVHEARKSIKRIRAALRLGRGSLGRKTFKQENQTFRDLGRQLSDVRDAEVLGQAFDKIKPAFGADHLRGALTIVSTHVATRRHTLMKKVLGTGRAVERASAALQAARKRARKWNLHGKGWPALKSGFERTYIQGRDRLDRAYVRAASDDFHAWRKRVKDPMYQVRLLRGAWPGVFEAWIDDLDKLADLLGEDHDLAMLQLTIGQELRERIKARDREFLLIGINRRRSDLEDEAQPLGRTLFAHSPRTVIDRIGACWALS